MNTQRFVVDPDHFETAEALETLDRAAAILAAGGTVAFPTETVYGLGANALNDAAVLKLFEAKQRPAWDPVIVHIIPAEMLEELVEDVPESARKLIAKFWPGPLTLLLPRKPSVPDIVTAGRPLVGVRMPAHPVAQELIWRAGVPIAAPSANLFGHISPTTAAHVLADLDGVIDAVVDAGPALHGLESTVIDPCQSPMVIYRPGAISIDQIREVAGEVVVFRPAGPIRQQPKEALPSPGVGLRHYAPKARLLLVEGPLAELANRLAEATVDQFGERVGVMLPTGVPAPPAAAAVFAWGRWGVPEELGRELYNGLRALDAEGCTVILSPIPPGEGIAAAIRDRLMKAAQ